MISLSIKKSIAAIAVLIPLCFCNCDKDDEVIPTAGFSYTSIKSLPATAQFTNLSSTQGPSSTFEWNFGDGTTSTAANPSHLYAAAGTYQVTLTQFPTGGGSESTTRNLMISTTGPSGISHKPSGTLATDFSMNITYGVPYFVTFTNTSINAENYYWDFGDNSSSNSTAATFTHTFNSPGPYYVLLTATNSNGTDTSGVSIRF